MASSGADFNISSRSGNANGARHSLAAKRFAEFNVLWRIRPFVIADPAAIPAPHPRADMRRQISAGRFPPQSVSCGLCCYHRIMAGTRSRASRRAFLAFALAAPRLAAQSQKGAALAPEWLRYQDPTTELEVVRLTDPAYASAL